MEPEERDPILDDDDALSLWVGRVVRTHAHLEYNVDNVHRLLLDRTVGAPDGKAVKGFDQRVSECRTLLLRSDADREVLTAGDTALLAAKQVTSTRNRVVHDMWLADPSHNVSDPHRWNAFRRTGDKRDNYTVASSHNLAMVIDTQTLLTRTRLRVSGLFMALHATWVSDHDRVDERANIARYVALMADQFTLHANGDFDVA